MSEAEAKSRRKRLGVVPLHVDVYPSTRAWLNNQRKARGMTWRGYFSQLQGELRELYRRVKDLSDQLDDKDAEILMLQNKLSGNI